MLFKQFFYKLFLPIIFLLLGFQSFAEPTIDEGKALFKANCNQCHVKDMKTDLTGPALGGVEERWADYPREDLYSWIRQSQKLIDTGHPRAVELWDKWGSVMNNFPNLTDDQLESLLLYIDGVYTGKIGGPVSGAISASDSGSEEEDNNNMPFYLMILGILAVLALILARIVANLNHMADSKDGTATGQRQTLLEQILSPSVIGFVLFALIIIGGYITVNNAMDLGRQKGYAPQQPIKFSHATHAGDQKIDCQYCHDGARRSKHSVIPATNTCMNCHTAIKQGSKYGTAELSKIHASAGWNPNSGKYFEDDASDEVIEKEFRDWIATSYKKEKGEDVKEKAVTKHVDNQWAAIKDFVNKPIEWNKIHNLPDHVYFNHAQHVSVGKVECQTCHGKVEEMEVVEQFSPLSMGWCVNCHRETKVQFADNPYYDSYEAYHKELKDGSRSQVTVEEIGGLECQKCHY